MSDLICSHCYGRVVGCEVCNGTFKIRHDLSVPFLHFVGPDGSEGWGVAYSRSEAESHVEYLNRAYALGQAAT